MLYIHSSLHFYCFPDEENPMGLILMVVIINIFNTLENVNVKVLVLIAAAASVSLLISIMLTAFFYCIISCCCGCTSDGIHVFIQAICKNIYT